MLMVLRVGTVGWDDGWTLEVLKTTLTVLWFHDSTISALSDDLPVSLTDSEMYIPGDPAPREIDTSNKDYLVPRFSRLVRPSRLQFQRSLRNWNWHSMIPRRMASRNVSAKPGSLRHNLFCLRDSLSKSHCFMWAFPWAEFVEVPREGKWVRASFPVRLKESRKTVSHGKETPFQSFWQRGKSGQLKCITLGW